MNQATYRKAASVFVIAVFALASIALSLAKTRSIVNRPTAPVNALRPSEMPRLVLWAWERPTDLRFIDAQKIGVAFLAKTIRLKANEVISKPRLQSLDLPEGAKVIAVTRIESDREHKPVLSIDQRNQVTGIVANLASLPNVSEIQIDFDATQSERKFYRDLIFDLRSRLPQKVRLSITALASWCMDDDWISDLPIDEAVPMLFRMAGDGKPILNRLDSGDDFNAAPCRQSYGISMDERRPVLLASRKLYVFNPGAWTESSVVEILESTK
jgi:hypothetical protein